MSEVSRGDMPNLVKITEMSLAELRTDSGYRDEEGNAVLTQRLIEMSEVLEHGASGVFLSSQAHWLSEEGQASNSNLARSRGNSDGRGGEFILAVVSQRRP